MGHYVARRLLQMIPVFIGSTLLVFLMMYALPGDPVRALAGEKAADPTQIAKLKAELGLDQPILVQYWNYLTGLFQGDFGTQIASRRPVADVIAEAWPVTAQLAVFALVFTAVVGIGMGVIAGLKPNSVQDRVLLFITLLLVSIPSFVLGRMTQTFFALRKHLPKPRHLGPLLQA